jgi:hypothetical protein
MSDYHFMFCCVEVTDPLLIVWIGLGGLGVNILGMILFAGNITIQLTPEKSTQ